MKRHLIVIGLAGVLAGCTTQPKPFNSEQQYAFAAARLSQVTANQEPVTGHLSLYDAMARALKYNLDAKVEIMASALKVRELKLADYSMLPGLVAGSGYAGRNTPDESTAALRDPNIASADLGFTWNVLDFGLSYVRAQQAADDVLIQEEKKRKVVNRIIEDVRTAYWRAASYERLADRLRELQGRVRSALVDTRRLSNGGETSPLVALTYERELIQVERQIQKIEGELKVAKSQLAALANIAPGSEFGLDVPKQRPVDLGLPKDTAKLYAIAASNRPEMREIAYELRVNDREADAAILELLPNFNLYAGPNYDSNQFIQTNDWVSYGAKISWNLMKLLAMPSTKEKIAAQDTLLQERSLSVAMAIMTQIQISLIRHDHLQKSYDTARELSAVQHKIVRQVKAETDAQRTSEQILIREEMNTLVADAEMDMVYADLQNAYANVYASLGIDPFPPSMSTSQSIGQISAELQSMWFERGEKLGDAQIHAASLRPVTITNSIPVSAASPATQPAVQPMPPMLQASIALPAPPLASIPSAQPGKQTSRVSPVLAMPKPAMAPAPAPATISKMSPPVSVVPRAPLAAALPSIAAAAKRPAPTKIAEAAMPALNAPAPASSPVPAAARPAPAAAVAVAYTPKAALATTPVTARAPVSAAPAPVVAEAPAPVVAVKAPIVTAAKPMTAAAAVFTAAPVQTPLGDHPVLRGPLTASAEEPASPMMAILAAAAAADETSKLAKTARASQAASATAPAQP